jgi:pSer/pThr/pTyr-binding forkhead associated (FHA) protein
MPITVIVRSNDGSDARLTFDGMQRVVIGRGASSDVRLPDSGVSHRHACIVSRGADFLVIDEGSTNGTFVGQMRVAPHTSRVVRSGDAMRVGRVWLELRFDQSPVTRDLAGATRDLALAIVSRAMAARGEDLTARVLVVEGKDQGATLTLAQERRAYVLGRGPQCDLAISDADASREHAHVERQGNVVVVRDLGAKNGTWLGEARAPENREAVWRSAQMLRIGRTVLALVEPVGDALAQIENAHDEELPVVDAVEQPAQVAPASCDARTPPHTSARGVARESARGRPVTQAPTETNASLARRLRTGLSIADVVVIATAVAVLAASLAGLLWLLRG